METATRDITCEAQGCSLVGAEKVMRQRNLSCYCSQDPIPTHRLEEAFIVVLTGCPGLQTDFTLKCMNLFKVAAGLGHHHGKHSSANLRRPSGNQD